ncbi:hypothetical protein Tco_0947874, partial [Tanacetum coccineum]
MPTEMELTLEQTQQGVSYEVSVLSDIEDSHGPSDAMHNPLPATQSQKDFVSKLTEIHSFLLTFSLRNIRVNSFTMKMEILLESTSNKLMVGNGSTVVDPHGFEGIYKEGHGASLEVKGSLDANEDIGVDEVNSVIDGAFVIGESNVESMEVRSKFGEFLENKKSMEEVVVGGGKVLGVDEDESNRVILVLKDGGGEFYDSLDEINQVINDEFVIRVLEGRDVFGKVFSVTPWAAKGRRRVLCYVQGSRRRRRKKSIGYSGGRRDCALLGASVFPLFNPGLGSFAHKRIWDPRIKIVFRQHLEGKDKLIAETGSMVAYRSGDNGEAILAVMGRILLCPSNSDMFSFKLKRNQFPVCLSFAIVEIPDLIRQSAYKVGLESVEARLDMYKNNEVVIEEDIKILKLDIKLRDNALTELRKKFEKAEKEKDDLKLTLEKFRNSSKNLSKLLEIQENDRYKTSEGYHAIPLPYTRNFMLPKYDLVLADEEEYVFSESVTSIPDVATSKAKTSVSKPKSVGEPLIE